MISNNSISKNKIRLLFIIKSILWVFISYFIIQISIGAKEIEEKRNIPGLQTTMEFANQYMKGKYEKDWEKLGNKYDYPDTLSLVHSLELSSDVGILLVSSAPGDDYFIMQIDMRKGNNSIRIETYYRSNFLHVAGEDNNISYYLEYENGNYTRNLQMEQETGFTTEEIVEQAEKMRNAFEEEMEKMHQYQIGRAKERREKVTNFGFIISLFFFLVYSFLKWVSINRRADIEDKYPEEVLEETIAKAEEKFLKRRYLLLGCGVSFWVHILIPVISEFILIPIEGAANEYTAYGVSAVISPIAYMAYGISAVITAVVLGLLWKSPVVEKKNTAGTVIQAIKNIIRFISGCVVTLAVIWMGISIVPRFLCPLLRFYKINLLADGIAFLIFSIIVRTKKLRIGTDNYKTEATEKEGFE